LFEERFAWILNIAYDIPHARTVRDISMNNLRVFKKCIDIRKDTQEA